VERVGRLFLCKRGGLRARWQRGDRRAWIKSLDRRVTSWVQARSWGEGCQKENQLPSYTERGTKQKKNWLRGGVRSEGGPTRPGNEDVFFGARRECKRRKTSRTMDENCCTCTKKANERGGRRMVSEERKDRIERGGERYKGGTKGQEERRKEKERSSKQQPKIEEKGPIHSHQANSRGKKRLDRTQLEEESGRSERTTSPP